MQNEKILSDAAFQELSQKLGSLQDDLESIGSALRRIRPSQAAGGTLEMGSTVNLTTIGTASVSGILREVIVGHANMIARLARYTGELGGNAARCAEEIADVENRLASLAASLGNGDDAPFEGEGGNGGAQGSGKPGAAGGGGAGESKELAQILSGLIGGAATVISDAFINLLRHSDDIADVVDWIKDGKKVWDITRRVYDKLGLGAVGEYFARHSFVDGGAGKRIADFFGEFVGSKGVGKAIANWVGPVLDLGMNIWDNYDEYKSGDISFGRMFAEIAVETTIDVGADLLVGMAVAAAPFTGGTSLVVGLAAGAAVTVLMEATGATEIISDGIINGTIWAGERVVEGVQWAGQRVADGVEWAGEAISDAADFVGDALDTAGDVIDRGLDATGEFIGNVGDAVSNAGRAASGWISNIFS